MSRFTTFTATYRIVTPMFCGGAGQEAELRLSSFKGALRFWWRTLQWGKVRDENELWAKEAELFGASDQRYGQSKVRMRLVGKPELEKKKGIGQIFEGGKLLGAHYLGYGVMEAFASKTKSTEAGQLTREMIPEGSFTVALRCGPNLGADKLNEIHNTLVMLGTVGGLGSKSRKGYGSLTLTSLDKDGSTIPLVSHPKQRLLPILQRLPVEQPSWSAWSQQARVVCVTGPANALQLLDKLGREFVHFRSWGNRLKDKSEHLVLGLEAEQNFPEDHHLSKGQPVDISHPKRVAFGLPHNYGKGDSNAVAPNELDRRASPLFFHIHQSESNSTPVGVLAFLPSLFLPEGEKLKSFGRNVELDRSGDFWDPIHSYLDRLLGKPSATQRKDSSLKATEVSLG